MLSLSLPSPQAARRKKRREPAMVQRSSSPAIPLRRAKDFFNILPGDKTIGLPARQFQNPVIVAVGDIERAALMNEDAVRTIELGL